MEQRARSYASSSLISFPSIPSNDDVEILDFSNNPLSSFSGLPTLSNLHTLIFDNTHLKSFQGARMEPNLKCISLLNTPLLQYLYLDLMTIIVFGNSVVKINNKDVAKTLVSIATRYRKIVRPYLVKGWILCSVHPLTLFHHATKQRKVIFIRAINDDYGNRIRRRSFNCKKTKKLDYKDEKNGMKNVSSRIRSSTSLTKDAPFNDEDYQQKIPFLPLIATSSYRLSILLQKFIFEENIIYLNDTVEAALKHINFQNFEDINVIVFTMFLAANIRPFYISEIVDYFSIICKKASKTILRDFIISNIFYFHFYSYSILAILILYLLKYKMIEPIDLKPFLEAIINSFEGYDKYISIEGSAPEIPFTLFFSYFSTIIKLIDPNIYQSIMESGLKCNFFFEFDKFENICRILKEDDTIKFSNLDINTKYLSKLINNFTPWKSEDYPLLFATAFCGAYNCFKSIYNNENSESLRHAAVAGGNEEIVLLLNVKNLENIAIQYHRNHLINEMFFDKNISENIKTAIEYNNYHALSRIFNSERIYNRHKSFSIHKREIEDFYLSKISLNSNDDSVFINNSNVGFDKTIQNAIKHILEQRNVEMFHFLSKLNSFMPNYKFDDGKTFLHLAIIYDLYLAVQILLKNSDLQINEQDDYGKTPLQYAVEYGFCDIILLLLQEPTLDINIQIKETGINPLLYAVSHENEEIVSLLLSSSSININIGDKEGWTPLSIACILSNIKIIMLLLRNPDIDLNKATVDGVFY